MNKNLILLGIVALASTYLFIGALKAQQKPSLSAYDPVVMSAFQQWQATWNKKYDDPDLSWYRFTVFAENYQTIQTVNADQSDLVLGQTEFMDLTFEEFSKIYLGTRTAEPTNVQYIIGTEGVAASIDWRTQGAVSEVKNQGQCGSCWAFSTTGALESLVRVKNSSDSRLFSEQDLVDCSSAQGNEGCNGGLMDNAFTYAISHGIASEQGYPYKGVNGTCKSVSRSHVVSKFTDVPEGNTDQLKAAVNLQPVAIAVNANLFWQLYHGGILKNCNTKQLNHGVLLVGYEAAGDWIVKNSWGATWGEKGFIRLAAGNTCGLANSASYPSA